MAGMMMWLGVSPSSWMMYSPRSDSRASMPLDSRKALRCISSETMLLPLTRVLAPLAWRMPRISSLACSQVSAQWTLMPFLAQLASSCSSSSGRQSRLRDRMAVLRSRRSWRSRGSGNWALRLAMRPSMARRKLARSWGSSRALAAASRKWTSFSACTGALPQEFGDVLDLELAALGLQRAVHVHQAAAVRGQDEGGAGGGGVRDLVGDHGAGDFGVAHREGAAEAAALVLPGEGRQLHVGELADEGLGLALQAQVADRMAGAVPGDLHRLAQVLQLHIQHIHEELGQLVDSCAEGLDLGLVRLAVEQLGIVDLHHARAAAGGQDHGQVLGEQGHLGAGHVPGLLPIAAVEGRLAAAGLALGVDHLHAGPAQELDAGHAGVREEQVHQAGAVEVDLLGLGSVHLETSGRVADSSKYRTLR